GSRSLGYGVTQFGLRGHAVWVTDSIPAFLSTVLLLRPLCSRPHSLDCLTYADNEQHQQVEWWCFFKSILMALTIPIDTELSPPNPIRVETALSRFPVHRLAKHGEIAIDIRERNETGEVSIKWEVTHNSAFGQPGPLAYKLDTLIINRRIEEAARPIPRIICLGSLNEISRELGQVESGGNTNQIRKSLHQNASSYITAKIRYRQGDGTERTLETGFTRYQVVFTGESL